MQKDRYKCKKCGSIKLTLKTVKTKTGLYCLDCERWVTWTDASRIKEDYKYILQFPENVDLVLTKTVNRGNNARRRCACGCLLKTFGKPAPQWQFDLSDATYCPKCGRKLI